MTLHDPLPKGRDRKERSWKAACRHWYKCIWLAVESLLLLLFVFLDLSGYYDESTSYKYAGILLCLLSAWVLYFLKGNTTQEPGGKLRFPSLVIPLALCFTALADLFLLVRDDHYVMGVGAFCVVQTLYALHLKTSGKVWILRMSLFAVLCVVAFLGGFHEPEVYAGAYSMSQLLLNVVFGWIAVRKKSPVPHAVLFALALTFFLCCDICVGLRNLPDYIAPVLSLPAGATSESASGLAGPSRWLFTVADAASVLIWIFYLPSQVMIVLSNEERVW